MVNINLCCSKRCVQDADICAFIFIVSSIRCYLLLLAILIALCESFSQDVVDSMLNSVVVLHSM